MAYYEIDGGKPLRGTVQLSGAKNLASKLILASLLSSETCTLTNIPTIGETDIALQLIEAVGATTTRSGNQLTIHAAAISAKNLLDLPAKSRLSILMIGPLLFRTGSAMVPPVTGDQIGKRPVGFHLDALRALGVQIHQTSEGFQATINAQLQGCEITLPYPSVGATETIIYTASWANGTTILNNAAIEPEILALIQYLNAMGAQITVNTSARQITLQGVKSFHKAEQRVITDRLEAVSYASVALATEGDIFLKDADVNDLTAYLSFINSIGADVQIKPNGIRVAYSKPLKAASFETSVHPGFMADWQQPSVVVLCKATGISTVHETVYEDRLRYTSDLIRMGANIEISTECLGDPCRFHNQGFRHSARITGPTNFQPTKLVIPDIRAGMAHVIAALVAPGLSQLTNIEHLDRGYERLQEKLTSVGANIRRVEEE